MCHTAEICESFQSETSKTTIIHQQLCEFLHFINQKMRSLKMIALQKSTFLQQNSFH